MGEILLRYVLGGRNPKKSRSKGKQSQKSESRRSSGIKINMGMNMKSNYKASSMTGDTKRN